MHVLRMVGTSSLASPKAVKESGMILLTCLADCGSLKERGLEDLSSRTTVAHIILSNNAGSTTDLGDVAQIDPTGGDLTCDEAAGAKIANTFAFSFLTDDTVLGNHVELTAGERKDRRIERSALRDGDVLKTHVGEIQRV
jgi:hypothetical protein